MSGAVLGDRLSGDVFENQVQATVIGGAAVVDAGDVRVLELGQDLALGAKAVAESHRSPSLGGPL